MAKKAKESEPLNIEKRKYLVTVEKKNNGYDIITGVYEKRHLSVKSLIRKIMSISDYGTHYIGATENLDGRWKKYPDWEFKQVLYETSSFKGAKKAEKDLIRYGSDHFPSCNIDPESKGLKEGAAIYYIYILADNTCQMRG